MEMALWPYCTRRLRAGSTFRLLLLRHRLAFIGLWIIAVGYGCLVEIKGALDQNRHTDVGTYFSAAWAIRIGSDPYSATDLNGWHYTYPPLLAVLISPLADAPPGMLRPGLLPYPVSVGLWYALSVLFLVAGVSRLAMAVIVAVRKQNGVDSNKLVDPITTRRWAWRWWMLCFWPVLLCLPVICRSVIRGQVGPLWLMLICMMIANVMEQNNFRAGLWLAGAICLKLIPAYLLLYALWRRNTRLLIGCATGLLLGFVIIPWAAMGTHLFITANEHYLQNFVLPAITGGRIDPVIEHELTDPRTSDTQSIVAILMNCGHLLLGTPRTYTPPLFAKVGHILFALGMTGLTLAAAGVRKRFDSIDELLFLGLLSTAVLPIAPVCHPHYYILMIPVIMGVIATFIAPRGQQRVTWSWIFLLAIIPLAHIFTSCPSIQVLRDTGIVTWAAILFWAAGTRLLWQRTHSSPSRQTFAIAQHR